MCAAAPSANDESLDYSEYKAKLQRGLVDLDTQLESQFQHAQLSPELLWLATYTRHHRQDLLLPAVQRMARSPQFMQDVPRRARLVQFLAGLFQTSLAGPAADSAIVQTPMLTDVELLDMVSALHMAGKRSTQSTAKDMAALVTKSKPAMAEVVSHILAAPALRPSQWPSAVSRCGPTPGLAAEFTSSSPEFAALLAKPGMPSSYDGFAQLAMLRRTFARALAGDTVLPEGVQGEVPSDAGSVRTAWGTLAGSVQVEALWGEFYATGRAAPLAQIVAMTSAWAPFGDLPGAINSLADLSAPLPQAAKDLIQAAADPAQAAVDCNVSRIAVHTLLDNARYHPEVWQAVADAVSDIAVNAVSLEGPGNEQLAADAALTPSPVAQAKLAVLPAMLHLMSQST